MLSEELEVSKQTIFNNIKRLNIETVKQENTSFIKEDTDVEKIIKRVNENKKKYGFEINTEDRKKNESDNINVESKSDTQIIEILKNQIDTLNSQMEKQESRHEITIEFYRKELQERSKLLENQQILALESNKKIQKLENQLEEERQLNYYFNPSTNDRENVNAQEAKFTEEVKNVNQQYENQTAEDVGDRNKEVPEESNDSNLEEDELLKNNNASEETKNNHGVKVEQPPKKGFWSRLFGN
ncbi:PF04394 family protein [Staphylococcus epidermidis VCU118]|nr:PF04394 family protein [Staphylococcus epidermidis VCU118]